MPVEVTHLHSSLEGVTPTEVRSSLTFSEALTLFRFVAHSSVSVYLKLQVHTGGQPVLPVPCHSFVASGRHGEPDAPAIKGEERKEVTPCHQSVSHTHTHASTNFTEPANTAQFRVHSLTGI